MTTTAGLTLTSIPLSKLAPHPDNVRRQIGDVDEISESIAGVGILEPLLVLPLVKGKHLVVAGNRRLAGARKAKLTEAPCIIRDLTEAEVIEAMLVENLQRNDLTPIEEAKAYGRLVELDTTVAEIAAKVGRSQAHVKGRVALLQLPDPALELLGVDGDQTVTLEGLSGLTKYSGQPDAIDAWLAVAGSRKKGWDNNRNHARREPAAWVKSWIADREHAAEVEALMAKFERSGLTRWTPKESWGRPLSWLDSLNTTVRLDLLKLEEHGATAHRKEPCHAVFLQNLDRGKPEMIPVCTSPLRHSTKAPAAKRSALQMDPELYKNTTSRGGSTRNGPSPKAKKTMRLDRSAFVAELLDKPLELDSELLELVLCALNQSTQAEAHGLASAHLGGTQDHQGWYERKHGPATIAQRLVALALAQLRTRDWNPEGVPQFCAFLEAQGYQPSDAEKPFFEAELEKWRKYLAEPETDGNDSTT